MNVNSPKFGLNAELFEPRIIRLAERLLEAPNCQAFRAIIPDIDKEDVAKVRQCLIGAGYHTEAEKLRNAVMNPRACASYVHLFSGDGRPISVLAELGA